MISDFFAKFRFIWIFLITICFGLYLGGFGIKELTISPNKMSKETGIIDSIIYGDTFLYIHINSSSRKYKTSVTPKKEIIKKNLKVGDIITIYTKSDDFNFIQIIEKNNKIIVDYEKQVGFSLFLLFIGISIIVFSFYYLKKKLNYHYPNSTSVE